MKKKTLATSFEVKSLDSETGVFEGYGSVFGNVDRGSDVVEKGAFEKTLQEAKEKKRMPAMLWQHDQREPIGVYTEMKEDDYGLFVRGQLALGTERGKQAHELMKMGALSGLSIGYALKRYEIDEEAEVLRIKELELWEVSLVTFPMNEEARVETVKQIVSDGEMPTEREFERFLRDAGFSKKQAKIIVANGFKTINKEDDDLRWDAEEIKELDSELDKLAKKFLTAKEKNTDGTAS